MIRKRKNAQGQITSYQVRLWDPNHGAGGGMRSIGSRRTLKEARALERAASRDIAAGTETPTTVREYAAVWLRTHPRQDSTMKAYAADIAVFVADFGQRKMSAIGRKEARAWALGQPRNRVAVVRTFYYDAIDDEVIRDNPFAKLGMKQSRGRRDLVVLTESELDHLVDGAYRIWERPYADVIRALTLFSGWVACRPGEAYDVDHSPGVAMCADGREHPTSYVDWDAGEVHILGQRRPDKTRVHFTKNGRVRRVVLADKVLEALDAVLPHEDTRALFYSVSGMRFHRATHFPYWEKLRNLAGRPGMDYYELRHFGATELLRRGMSHADVAVHMGHTDGGALVMSTYGHPEEDAARARIRDALRPSAATAQERTP